MKIYKVEIREKLRTVIQIAAENEEAAKEKAMRKLLSEEIKLSEADSIGVNVYIIK